MNRPSGQNQVLQLDIMVLNLLAIFLLHVHLLQPEHANPDLTGNLFISSTVNQYRNCLLPFSNNSPVRDARALKIYMMITTRTEIHLKVGNQAASVRQLMRICQILMQYQTKVPLTAEGILSTTIWRQCLPQQLHQCPQWARTMPVGNQVVKIRISINRHRRPVLSPIYVLPMRYKVMP